MVRVRPTTLVGPSNQPPTCYGTWGVRPAHLVGHPAWAQGKAMPGGEQKASMPAMVGSMGTKDNRCRRRSATAIRARQRPRGLSAHVGLPATASVRTHHNPRIYRGKHSNRGRFCSGDEASSWFGIDVPNNTPAEIVDKLNRQINFALADPR